MGTKGEPPQLDRPPPLSVTFIPRKPTSFPVSPFRYRVYASVIFQHQVAYHSLRGFIGHVRNLAARGNHVDALGLLHGYLNFEKQKAERPFLGEPSMDFETAIEQVKYHTGMEYDQRWIEYEAMVANPEYTPRETFHEEYIFPPPPSLQTPAIGLPTTSAQPTTTSPAPSAVLASELLPSSSSLPPAPIQLTVSPQSATPPRLSCPHCREIFGTNQELYRHVKACQPQKSTPALTVQSDMELGIEVSTVPDVGLDGCKESHESMKSRAEPTEPAEPIASHITAKSSVPAPLVIETGTPGIESGVSELGEVREAPREIATAPPCTITSTTAAPIFTAPTTTAPLPVGDFRIPVDATKSPQSISSPSAVTTASTEPTGEAHCYDCGTIFESQKTMHKHYAIVHLGYAFEKDKQGPPPSRPKFMTKSSRIYGRIN